MGRKWAVGQPEPCRADSPCTDRWPSWDRAAQGMSKTVKEQGSYIFDSTWERARSGGFGKHVQLSQWLWSFGKASSLPFYRTGKCWLHLFILQWHLETFAPLFRPQVVSSDWSGVQFQYWIVLHCSKCCPYYNFCGLIENNMANAFKEQLCFKGY